MYRRTQTVFVWCFVETRDFEEKDSAAQLLAKRSSKTAYGGLMHNDRVHFSDTWLVYLSCVIYCCCFCQYMPRAVSTLSWSVYIYLISLNFLTIWSHCFTFWVISVHGSNPVWPWIPPMMLPHNPGVSAQPCVSIVFIAPLWTFQVTDIIYEQCARPVSPHSCCYTH